MIANHCHHFICLIIISFTICSSDHLSGNQTLNNELTSLDTSPPQDSTLSSDPLPNSSTNTQSATDVSDEEDIELTTYATIQNNNRTKGYFSDFQLNRVNTSDENVTQRPTSSSSAVSITTDHSVLNHTSILTNISQPNSNKILNKSVETGENRRTNPNPSVDEILSGILQLIGGNVKLSRPSLTKLQPLMPARAPDTRINNRGPPKVPLPMSGPMGAAIANMMPPNVVIGPGRPAGIALPLPPPHMGRPPVPMNTKPPFIIPESDVNFLLGLIKPHIKDDKEMIALKNLPKPQTSQMKDKSVLNTLSQSRPMFTDKILANPSKIQELIQSNSYYSNIFSSLSSHLMEASTSKISTAEPESETHSEDNKISTSEMTVSSFIIPSKQESPVPTGPVTDWVPLIAPSSVSVHESATEEPIIITMPEEPSIFEMIVKQQIGPKPSVTSSSDINPTQVVVETSSVTKSADSTDPSDIKPTSTIESVKVSTNSVNESKGDPDIVYGRPAPSTEHTSIAPSFTTSSEDIITLLGSGQMSTSSKPISSSRTIIPVGKPIVVPVEMEEVKPQVGPNRPNPNRHPNNPDRSKPSIPTLQVGSGVIVSGDEKDDKKGILQPNGQNTQTKPLIVRRPPFRPRPNGPIVRIDTCIVGDDSTCEVALNEKCLTELGLSSCQCRPGFSRTQARSPCVPVVSLALSLKVDRMGDKKLTFNRNLLSPDSEEYQYLEFESLQGLNSIFASSKLSKVYMGSKVNRFYSVAGKTIVNASINLELNNATNSPSIKRYVQQELTRVIAVRNNNIGDSQLWVDGSLNAIPRVEDLNECATTELNDCSKFAKCYNEFGGFRCECDSGYEDKFPNDKLKSGRFCSTCSPQYCSNRGECYVSNGQRECKCKGNFIGSKCDIDAEVLGVALGGSVAALVIIIITFLCLYMWNQRWKKEQQKMEAMSAASGHTFSYVNKQAATAYRLTIDDRMRWAQIAEAMASNPNYSSNFYASPDQMSSSQHHLNHVYATPNRVSSSGTLLNDELCAYESRQYSRSLRPKSRTASATHAYSVKNGGNDSIYNETEFSTREMLYSPTHLIPAPRSQFSYS